MYCGIEIFYALILSLGAVTFGFILGYPSPVIPVLKQDFGISQTQSTLFNAISSLTAIAGPYFTQFLLSFMGRKPATFIISICGAVFWALLLIMTKETFWIGITLRALLGVIMGACSSIIPMYIVELSPKGHSGFFGTINNLGISIGLVILYLLGTWLNWESLAIVGASICLLLSLLIWLVPESPAKNEIEKSGKESLCQSKFTKPMIIGIALMFFQQFSGINAILTNLTELFEKAGVKISSGIASAISSSAQVITIFLSGFFIDKTGRKPAWVISASGVVGFLILYSFATKFGWGEWVPIISVFMFLFFYGIATGPVAWYIVPELFPSSVRSLATAIASSVNWLCAFIVIFLFPELQHRFGDFGSLLFFAAIEVLSIIFGLFCITEPAKEATVAVSTTNAAISDVLLETNDN